jgi:hypothetical protein
VRGARWIVPALFAAAGCTIDAFPARIALGDGGMSGCGEAGVVDLLSNRSHCGACTIDCTALPHVLSSGVSCTVGRCAIGACAPGWLNCDGNPENGCEADVRDPTSCGRCGVTCRDATPLCRAFAAAPAGDAGAGDGGVAVDDVSFEDGGAGALTFRCVDNCAAGRVRCDDPPACVDLMTDQRACGACGTACVPRANAATACVAGACAPTCLAGFRDCDGDLAMATSDGCEVNTATSATNCGACGMSCPAGQNRLARCLDGVCAPGECMAGFADCDADPANGCETTLATSATHCGMCGRACEFANAASTCAAGACVLMACNAGFGNCDGVNANGCETNTRTNIDHCGACGTACPTRANSSPTCIAGACGISCNPARGNCDGDPANGCEVDTANDRFNCNTCGTVCNFCGSGLCI